MKKWTALLLTLALALSATSAMAAGKLTVNQETYVAAEGYSLKSYIFAEVENTGDKNIAFNDGLLEILNADGDPTDNETIYRMYPEILAPGEKGYITDYLYPSDASTLDDIADYSLVVTGKSTKDEAPVRLEAAAEYGMAVSTWDSETAAVRVTVTNTTEATLYECNMVFGLYDAEGKLLYAASNYAYNTGLPAGQSMEMLFPIDEELTTKWEADGVKPATASAFAFVSTDSGIKAFNAAE